MNYIVFLINARGLINYGSMLIQLPANNLTGNLPASLDSITNLSYISLSNNQLSGNIPDLGNTNISTLDLSHNKLTGSIPPIPGNAGVFSSLDLSYNSCYA